MDPTFARAGQTVRITKIEAGKDPNFKGGGDGEIGANRQVRSLEPDVRPVYGMPSGPGFPAGDPLGGGKRKRKSKKTRTYPFGILRSTAKILPSKSPTKSPTRKHKVRINSKTAKKSIRAKKPKEIREMLIGKGLLSSEKKNVPPHILQKLYTEAVGAGLLNE